MTLTDKDQREILDMINDLNQNLDRLNEFWIRRNARMIEQELYNELHDQQEFWNDDLYNPDGSDHQDS
jgi:hypothetical protein